MKKIITKFMKGKYHILILVITLSIQEAYAQTVSGQVTDESNEPIPGVNIDVIGTTDGTTTDANGKFELSASPESILEFSYIGYVNHRITVGSQQTINVKLVTDSKKLDEVVVIGYGTAKKSDLAGSVSQVSTDAYENTPVVRVESALQGRASGVSVAGGGQPGKPIKVRIRGVNSVTGDNSPLVVVDGVFGGDLKSINPSDIASMEILKDASALAIYGSRGSNGVILVTTKKGRKGKTKFHLDQFVSISSFPKKIDKLSSAEFAELKNQEKIADGNAPGFTAEEIAKLRANPYDWEDFITRTAIGYNTQLSMSGSSGKVSYFVSGNYMQQDGTQINTEYNRASLRANIGIKVNERLNIGLNVYGSREFTLNDQEVFDDFNGSMLLRAITWNPASPVKDENGKYIYKHTEYGNNGWNPVYSLKESKHEVYGDRLNATLNGTYKILDNLSYTLVANASSYYEKTQALRWEKDPDLGVGTRFNFLVYNDVKLTTHQVSNILNYKLNFDEHNIDLTGVYEFQGQRRTINRYNAEDVNVSSFFLGDDGNSEFFNNDGVQSSIQSYLGRVQYNFNRMIYITGSLRVDESSKFTKGNRTGYFPSVAIAYSFNNLNLKSLTFLKLRGGWGQVGNENISAKAAYSLSSSGLYSFNGVSPVSGQALVQISNPDLTWETTTQYNVGVDFGLYNRVNGSIDFYIKDTNDLLLKTTITGTSYDKFENVGKVKNQGLDLSLNADIIKTNDFIWNAGINISLLNNEIVELIDNLKSIPGNILPIGGTQNNVDVYQVGKPIGTFYGYTFLGTWKTAETAEAKKFGRVPGDPKYKRDSDGNLILGAIGNGLPSATWGFNNTLKYKSWDLNIFVNAASGFSVYNFVASGLAGRSAAFRDNLSLSRRNEWTVEKETDEPRRKSIVNLNSSQFVEDGSFIRLSNVKLGYHFKDFNKWIDNLEVYVSGQNLFLLTNYSGYDPEVSSTPNTSSTNVTATADNATGIDQGAYPNPMSYTIGVKLKF